MRGTGLEVNGVRWITVAGKILGLGSDEVERLGGQVLDDVAATGTCREMFLMDFPVVTVLNIFCRNSDCRKFRQKLWRLQKPASFDMLFLTIIIVFRLTLLSNQSEKNTSSINNFAVISLLNFVGIPTVGYSDKKTFKTLATGLYFWKLDLLLQ